MGKKELIEKGETQSLEFKESLRLKDEIGETVSAFSNSDGGTVIVGVSDSGVVLGAGIGKKTIEELANYIKRNTDPRILSLTKIIHSNFVIQYILEKPPPFDVSMSNLTLYIMQGHPIKVKTLHVFLYNDYQEEDSQILLSTCID